MLALRRWFFLPVCLLFWAVMAPVILAGHVPHSSDEINGLILAAATTVVWLVGIPWMVKTMRDGR